MNLSFLQTSGTKQSYFEPCALSNKKQHKNKKIICFSDTDASMLMSGQPAVQEADPHQDSSVSSAGEKTFVPVSSFL